MIKLSIMSPEEKREMDKVIEKQRKTQRELEIIRDKITKEEWVEKIFNDLKKLMNINTKVARLKLSWKDFRLSHTDINGDSHLYFSASDLRETCDIVIQLFQEVGYDIHLHEYSKSWQSRSGYFCEIFIYW